VGEVEMLQRGELGHVLERGRFQAQG
jgi:hypothetical protein